ncbi:MAG: hypothetical protein K9W43_01195 [Candidatus Thorarchaeota archaeon]|nr:hypothetical protein [Candidatus Thorarchaeota archaeon]
MKLPVCIIDLESDFLCPSCQDKLDRGRIDQFDIEFSKWILERAKEYLDLDKLNLLRAIRIENRLILVVKKSRDILLANTELMEEMKEKFGEVLILEGPAKLRTIVRKLIAPAIEVGINSLYLPDGFRESIVMLRSEDRGRIPYSKEELREIVSAVTGESVIFEYQDEREEKKREDVPDVLEDRLRGLSKRR